MKDLTFHCSEIETKGFTVINSFFSGEETALLLDIINKADQEKETFRKSDQLFAIRQFLKEIPESKQLILTEKLRQLILDLFGTGYFVTKSIYFDKPETSNWFVAYHQDLTISVDKRIENENYGPWTVKHQQFAVQPPLNILEQGFTFRIHLDDTNAENGALKVIPGSHLKKVYRPETINWQETKEVYCDTAKGGIMVMRPLLLHASDRTTNQHKRRVIHIEFNNLELAEGLNWSEKIEF